MTYKQWLLYISLFFFCVSSIIFVYNNESFYKRPIAEVVETSVEDTTNVTDEYGNNDQLYQQKIVATIKNGKYKGEHIQLANEYRSEERRVGEKCRSW